MSDLAGIVVAAESPPDGMDHNATADEAGAVLGRPGPTEPRKAALAQALADAGFLAGRYTEFSGDAGALLSWVALFDTVEHAEQAFALNHDELRSEDGYGLEAPDEAGLGDEGTCDEGDVVLETGPLHESICLWRVANLVLAAGGPFDAELVRATAEGMTGRIPD